MSRTATFYGLTDANEKTLSLAKILSMLLPIVSATVTLSTTFFMIFVAEAVGHGSFIEGLGIVGVLVVFQMLVQVILDYPTGAIGDWIGQRYIIAAAFGSFAVAFFMVSFVNSATPFAYLIVIYIFMGLGNSQMSGSFMAWFDNNYRIAMPGDENRKQYGVFMGRVGMLFQIVSTLSLIPGAILATVWGRPWVFQVQALLSVLIAITVLRFVKDFPEVEAAREKRPTMSEYTNLLKSGVSFLVSDKFVFYVIIGGCVMFSSTMVWGNLILFPLYFSYLLTDIAVSSYRTILFIPGVFSQERSGIWSRRFEPKKWIPRFRFLQLGGSLFYMLIAVIMWLLPPAAAGSAVASLILPFTDIVLLEIPAANLLPVLLLTSAFIGTSFTGAMAEILTQRLLLDVIPNRIRNSMYSLTPTLMTIFAMPQIAFFGWLLSVIGFPITLAIISAISLGGVFLIRRGLSYPIPKAHDDSQDKSSISEAIPTVTEGEPVEEAPQLALVEETVATLKPQGDLWDTQDVSGDPDFVGNLD
ncbi:MAG: MFS transporter [Candidatus Thorarchaeota archaeon]|nr:MAG: MFS transporter [Candidatus Thorarchaeota archaeon]